MTTQTSPWVELTEAAPVDTELTECYSLSADQSRNAGVLVLESLRLVSQLNTVVDRTPVISGIPRAALVSGAGVRYDGGSGMPYQRKDESHEDFLARRRVYSATYRPPNPEKDREHRRVYAAKYREQHLEACRERIRSYHATHREEGREYNRSYHAANIDVARDRSRAYRIEHAEQAREYQVTTRRATPSAYRAHNAVASAIVSGCLVPPTVCSACQTQSPLTKLGRRTIEAHHHLGYEPEYKLDVIWLCKSCHKRADQKREGGD